MALPYTAYLDESGTHGGSEVTIVCGVLARTDQWKRFQIGFDKAKREHGFNVFHTRKFKNRDGDFKGWSNAQQLALMVDIGALTGAGLTDAVAVSLDNADFKNYYRDSSERRKGSLDSKYGLCFRTCLYYLILEVEKRKYRGKIPHLNLIVEAGHANSGAAIDIFNELKREFEDRGGDMLQTIKIAEKDECDPLMIADFLAHTSLMINRKARQAGSPLPPSQNIPRGATGITHLQSTPQALIAMRERIFHPRKER